MYLSHLSGPLSGAQLMDGRYLSARLRKPLRWNISVGRTDQSQGSNLIGRTRGGQQVTIVHVTPHVTRTALLVRAPVLLMKTSNQLITIAPLRLYHAFHTH